MHLLSLLLRLATNQSTTAAPPPDPLLLQIDLGQLYDGVAPVSHFRLRSLISYYGRHYLGIVLLPELEGLWVMVDDASAKAVGTWADVQARCEKGQLQPTVLFYEAMAS